MAAAGVAAAVAVARLGGTPRSRFVRARQRRPSRRRRWSDTHIDTVPPLRRPCPSALRLPRLQRRASASAAATRSSSVAETASRTSARRRQTTSRPVAMTAPTTCCCGGSSGTRREPVAFLAPESGEAFWGRSKPW